MMNFVGSRIKKAREDIKISQKKLGMILGLSDKAISAYEAGRTFPPIDTLFKIADELDKPIIYFLTENEKEKSLIERLDSIEKSLKDISEDITTLKSDIVKD